jgi:hypothetical protein
MAARGDNAIFAECKWRDAEVGIDVYNDLKRKADIFNYQNVYFYIFAKSKFSSKLINMAREQGNVRLTALPEMVKAVD